MDMSCPITSCTPILHLSGGHKNHWTSQHEIWRIPFPARVLEPIPDVGELKMNMSEDRELVLVSLSDRCTLYKERDIYIIHNI